MYYIIDRFENGIAVCEDEKGTLVEFPAEKLPEGAAEGQRLMYDGEIFTIADNAAAEQRIKSKMDMLFGK